MCLLHATCSSNNKENVEETKMATTFQLGALTFDFLLFNLGGIIDKNKSFLTDATSQQPFYRPQQHFPTAHRLSFLRPGVPYPTSILFQSHEDRKIHLPRPIRWYMYLNNTLFQISD
ncbi:hypothetical protein ACJX0J_031853, partial [Zea mays]